VTIQPTSSHKTPLVRQRIIIIIAILLLVGGTLALYFAFRAKSSPEPPPEVTFEASQEGEFLIIVTAFLRTGGDPQPIGGVLANDLRQQSEAPVRVEMLPRAPDPATIPDILTTYNPRIFITGSYNAEDIHATVIFTPPTELPPSPDAAANGNTALFPPLTPVQYQLYAPLGSEHPLRYLQAWVQAQSLFWRGYYTDALAPLSTAKSLLPPSIPLSDRTAMDHFAATINWQLGYIAGPVQGNWQAAQDLFRDALRLNPNDPTAALGLAAAFAQLSNLEHAALLLRQTLREHPDSWQIYFALAQIDIQQGDTATGFSHYEHAISLLQNDTSPAAQQALADVYFNRGYQLLNLGEYDKAQSDFQKALDLGRDDIYVQGNLGWAAYMAGDYETAIRASAAARQLAPQRPDLAFNEALHLLAAGQIDAARTAYREAIDLTLSLDDTLTRSTYFGVAYKDLADLQQRQPSLSQTIKEIQQEIDIANG